MLLNKQPSVDENFSYVVYDVVVRTRCSNHIKTEILEKNQGLNIVVKQKEMVNILVFLRIDDDDISQDHYCCCFSCNKDENVLTVLSISIWKEAITLCDSIAFDRHNGCSQKLTCHKNYSSLRIVNNLATIVGELFRLCFLMYFHRPRLVTSGKMMIKHAEPHQRRVRS